MTAGNPPLPFHAKYAIIWPTDNSAGASLLQYTSAWNPVATPASLKTGFTAGAHMELSIGLADLGLSATSTVDTLGTIVQNVGSPTVATLTTWPSKAASTNYVEFLADAMNSCHTPADDVTP